MALQIWLPLHSNFKNNGLTNIEPTLTGNPTFTEEDALHLQSTQNINTLYGNGKPTSSMTVSVWVKPHNDCDSKQIISVTNNGSNQRFYCGGKNVTWNLGFGNTVWGQETNATIDIDVWQHICIVTNGAKATLYKNGQITNCTKTASGEFSLAGNFRLGGTSGQDWDFYDFRIYDNSLIEQDIKRIYQEKIFELVPYSGVEDVLFDRSGFMLMPLVNNGADFQTNCLYFDGTNDQLRPKVTDDGFNISGGTLSIWFTPTEKPNKNRLIYTDEKSHMSIGFSSTGNSLIVRCGTSNGNTNGLSTTGISWGSLNNVIVTYNNTMPQICLINGIVPSVYTTSTGFTETAGKGLTIGGRQYNTTSRFDGKIYKVAVYNRQFTQDEAVELYNSERGMFLPDEYEQLEYIEGDGTQWLDLGIQIGSQDNIKMELMFKNDISTFFGATESGSYNTKTFNATYAVNRSTVCFYTNQNTTGTYSITCQTQLNTKIEIKWYGNPYSNFTINGAESTTSSQISSHLYTPQLNAYLFSRNNNGSPTSPMQMILYGFYVENKMNLVPAKRKSDNVIGAYDLISRRFLTSSGTNPFTGE